MRRNFRAEQQRPSIIRGAKVYPHKRDLARKFRRNPTASERHAWQLLRNRRCMGLKFRRQQVIRGYIVDFYCAELHLALEIDGPVHFYDELRFAYDLERLERLDELGIDVLRIRPQDVAELPDILAWYLTP